MIRAALLLICTGLATPAAVAAEPVQAAPAPVRLRPGATMPPAWPAQIAAADLALFDAGFTHCDADKMATMVTDDFEFFHDKDGLSITSGAQFVTEVRGHCQRLRSGEDFPARRELIADSVRFYPINNYGVIQVGEHRFYAVGQGGQPDRLTETARFTHVWKNEQGQWKLARVLSYDHRLAERAPE